MVSILLTILKIVGILLLALLGTVIVLLGLVLFVPIRYRVRVHRRMQEDTPFAADVRVSWLLRLVSARFSWPENAFLRLRLFGITIFRSDQKKKKEKTEKTPGKKTEENSGPQKKAPKPANEESAAEPEKQKIDAEESRNTASEKNREGENRKEKPGEESPKEEASGEEASARSNGKPRQGPSAKIREFFEKLLSLFRNIRYTIARICDKIKHIGNNIRYYLEILKSDTFNRAWTVCSGEAFSLLRSILPGKIAGSLVVGTGDPASTGQVLALYGILYPFLGSQISLTPDFERQILEGDLLIKGKITVFRGLKTAWRIYFNRDLRRLIKLFKREAA